MPARFPLTLAAVALALGVTVTACSSDERAADEWSIVPPKAVLTAGKVAITATNTGKEAHELVIIRADDAASLPKKADGSVDEDQIPESMKAGEIADLAAGTSRAKTLDLRAGDYLALCNIVETMDMDHMDHMGSGTMDGTGMEHVHFKLGMVNFFTVA